MQIIDLKQKEVINTATVKPLAALWMWNLIRVTGRLPPSSFPVPENSAVFSEGTANSASPGNVSVRSGKILFWWKSMRKNA